MIDNEFQISHIYKKTKSKRKLLILPLFIVSMALLVLLFANCSGRPADISEETYKAGSKAIEIVDNYLDYNLSKDDAYYMLSDICSRNSSSKIEVYIRSICFGKIVGCVQSMIFDFAHNFTKFFLDLLRFTQKRHMHIGIKVYIRQRCKKAVFHKANNVLVNVLTFFNKHLAVTAYALQLKDK